MTWYSTTRYKISVWFSKHRLVDSFALVLSHLPQFASIQYILEELQGNDILISKSFENFSTLLQEPYLIWNLLGATYQMKLIFSNKFWKLFDISTFKKTSDTRGDCLELLFS